MALSKDLRKRVVEAYRNGEGSQGELAERFCICRQTVARWDKEFEQEGRLEPKKTKRGPEPALGEDAEKVILQLCKDKPDSYLHEYQSALLKELSIEVTLTTINRKLQQMDLPRKKNGSRL